MEDIIEEYISPKSEVVAVRPVDALAFSNPEYENPFQGGEEDW